MQTDFQHRRDRAMQAIWDLQDSGLDDSSPEVVAAAQSAIAELRNCLRQAGAGVNPAETGLAWKYLGDAWFTLRATEQGKAALLEARKAYIAGEPILQAAGAPHPLAKLNFNLANTLRLIEGGYNRAHLEEARVHYQSAVRLFQQSNPAGVSTVLQSLQDLEIAIRALGFFEKSSDELDRSRKLQARLEQAGVEPDAETLRSIQQGMEPMQVSLQDDTSSLGRTVAPLTLLYLNLTEIANLLAKQPDWKITVEGHGCEGGQ